MIRFRTIFLILFILTILVILSPLILGLASTAFTYSGKCYGFTDGVWDCTWMEYAKSEILLSSLILTLPSLLLLANWPTALGFWLFKRRTSSPDKLTGWQAILIPIISGIVGCGLLSILSSIRR
jgi:ABC-type phosphate transport system permease subunit